MRFAAQLFVFLVWWACVGFVAASPIAIPALVAVSDGFGEAFWTVTGAYAFICLFWGAVWVGYR